MIKVSKLSYSFPQKDLYNKVSFEIEEGCHCAFIGTNGTGKTTLLNIIMNPDEYLYDGKIELCDNCTFGYVSQFSNVPRDNDINVTDYISEDFVAMENRINELCDMMADTDKLEEIFEQYQACLDRFEAADGNNYQFNIKNKLKLADLSEIALSKVNSLSGGEFKLIQVIKAMLLSPKVLVMDEPDAFLDFKHIKALRDLINNYKGTLIVITHNRYLLNHCFNKILHLENTQIQEFEGNYIQYNYAMLCNKIELMEMAAADLLEIERNERLVEKLRNEATAIDSSTKGRTLKARVSMLERLKARQTKDPFVEIKEPDISYETDTLVEGDIIEVTDYSIAFNNLLLDNISFTVGGSEKVAIIGNNGTGKTTILRDVYNHSSNGNDKIKLHEAACIGYLSQVPGETIDENLTIYKVLEENGFERQQDMEEFIKGFGFLEEMINCRISTLSGGEKNMLQLALLTRRNNNLLLLDEPTSHLDTYAQVALEKAIKQYKGGVLMVSHDFYTIANCMDYVLLVEDKTVRKMSIRKFRQMIYANHFHKDYLLLEQEKASTEALIEQALIKREVEKAKALSEDLAVIIDKMTMVK